MPWVPERAAEVLTLRSLPSVKFDVQVEKPPDSKLSAKIKSDTIEGGVGVRALGEVGLEVVGDGGGFVLDTGVAVGEEAGRPVAVDAAVDVEAAVSGSGVDV